uniref:Uncharacterized protein n=1 Tax=uncultured prokaryote TaxID=198431 RepID=A0A0H5QNX7_9ZZZZ|nr:hypothetical protein [uncultured prokaryote]
MAAGDIYEVVLDWVIPNSKGGKSVMYFSGETMMDDARTALNATFSQVKISLSTGCSVTIPRQGRTLDPATGGLVGAWTATGDDITIVGTGSADAVPNEAQLLIRFKTNTVVRNRFLQGRLFIPGITVSGVENGDVTSQIVSAGEDWFSDNLLGEGLVVWSRPTTGEDGSFGEVQSFNVWNEWASQRNRR